MTNSSFIRGEKKRKFGLRHHMGILLGRGPSKCVSFQIKSQKRKENKI